MLNPERVAAAWLRSGVPFLQANPDRPQIKVHKMPKAALGVPMMCNPGTKEGVTVKTGRFARVWPMNETFFRIVRGRGGLLGVSVDPLSAHECGNQRYMAIPWLDACLAARLPAKLGGQLKPMPTDGAWLAPLLGNQAVEAGSFQGNQRESVWLPNAEIAGKWMHYVRDTEIPDCSPPPAPTDVETNGNVLTWKAEADLESGISHFIIKRNGKEIGTVPEKPGNRFGRPLFQGLQYSDTPAIPLVKMVFTDTSLKPGTKAQYEVVAVNTVGLESGD